MQEKHTALRAQYDAEAAVNPEAWKNWQFLRNGDAEWKNCMHDLRFNDFDDVRRNPDAPPFVPHVALKRHKYADLIIAAANGEQMQINTIDLTAKSARKYEDCYTEDALRFIAAGNGNIIRIKPKTRTVQCRVYLSKPWHQPCMEYSENFFSIEKHNNFGGWLGEAFNVEVPIA
jgi:hypothetical protein